MPGGWLMWLFEHFGMEYETVKAADYDKLDALYDTIVLAPGVNRARIVSGLDMTRYPEEFAWAGGVGEAGWSKLAAFVTGGGTLLGLGSASETAQQLLNLPIQRVATTQPFSIGGSLLRETFDPTVPAAWGLPAEGSTYFNGDRAWNVSDPTAKIAGAYPGTGSDARVRLRGRRRAAARQGGHRQPEVRAGQRDGRRHRRRRSARWPRALWPIVANSVYHGPSAAVSAVDIKTLSAAAVAQESGEQPQPEPETPAPTTSAPDVKADVPAAPAEPAATPAPAPPAAGAVAGDDAGQGHRVLQAGQEPARGDVHDQGREGREPARRPRSRQGQGAPHAVAARSRVTRALRDAPEGRARASTCVSPAVRHRQREGADRPQHDDHAALSVN